MEYSRKQWTMKHNIFWDVAYTFSGYFYIPEDGGTYYSEISVNFSYRIMVLITVTLFRASYSMT